MLKSGSFVQRKLFILLLMHGNRPPENDLIKSIIFLHYEQITYLKYWGNCYQVYCRDMTEFSATAIKSAKNKETKYLGTIPRTMNHFYVKHLLLLFNIYSFIILLGKEAWFSLKQIYFLLTVSRSLFFLSALLSNVLPCIDYFWYIFSGARQFSCI